MKQYQAAVFLATCISTGTLALPQTPTRHVIKTEADIPASFKARMIISPLASFRPDSVTDARLNSV
jgi:hypothetical protein